MSPGSASVSSLLDGVVFAISGLANPERGELRDQALEMGAAYRPDWSNDCTLLVCAFPNTPKFKSVKAQGGTIVSKDWISECYKSKGLTDINKYLLFSGRPWTIKAKAEDDGSWFQEDLKAAVQWLEEQEDKPAESELEKVAAQGLVACLEDTLQSLRDKKGVVNVIDSWGFVPRALKHLQALEQTLSPDALILEAQKLKDLYSKKLDAKDESATELLSSEDDDEAVNEDEIDSQQSVGRR